MAAPSSSSVVRVEFSYPLRQVFDRVLREADEVLLSYNGGTFHRIVLDSRLALLKCFREDVTRDSELSAQIQEFQARYNKATSQYHLMTSGGASFKAPVDVILAHGEEEWRLTLPINDVSGINYVKHFQEMATDNETADNKPERTNE